MLSALSRTWQLHAQSHCPGLTSRLLGMLPSSVHSHFPNVFIAHIFDVRGRQVQNLRLRWRTTGNLTPVPRPGHPKKMLSLYVQELRVETSGIGKNKQMGCSDNFRMGLVPKFSWMRQRWTWTPISTPPRTVLI